MIDYKRKDYKLMRMIILLWQKKILNEMLKYET